MGNIEMTLVMLIIIVAIGGIITVIYSNVQKKLTKPPNKAIIESNKVLIKYEDFIKAYNYTVPDVSQGQVKIYWSVLEERVPRSNMPDLMFIDKIKLVKNSKGLFMECTFKPPVSLK